MRNYIRKLFAFAIISIPLALFGDFLAFYNGSNPYYLMVYGWLILDFSYFCAEKIAGPAGS